MSDTTTNGAAAPETTGAPPAEKKPETTATAVKKKRRASKAQRQAAAVVQPSGKTEFDGAKTVEALVAKHNEMVLTGVDLGLASRPVKTFVDVKTAVLACERLNAQIEKAREPKPEETGETKESKKMAKKRKSGNARKAVKGKTRAAKTGRTRASFLPDAKIVIVKGAENPAREGSGRHKRIAGVLASGGKTVAEFGKKGKIGTLSFCVKNKLVRVEGGKAA